MKYHPGREVTPTYSSVVHILRPMLMRITDRHWSGQENLPKEGGFIAVSNHVTNLDPLTFGHYLVDAGIPVKFLGKAELFKVPVVGQVLTGARQIPVHRGSSRAIESLDAAAEAIARGECIGIFAEGTLTHDPDMWPMQGRTGAARLALATGAPVIPVAQWGAHRIIPRYEVQPITLKKQRVDVMALPPVDLSAFEGKPLTAEVLRQATDAIMWDLTRGVAQLRGEDPPERLYDRRVDGSTRVSSKDARRARKEAEKAAKNAASR